MPPSYSREAFIDIILLCNVTFVTTRFGYAVKSSGDAIAITFVSPGDRPFRRFPPSHSSLHTTTIYRYTLMLHAFTDTLFSEQRRTHHIHNSTLVDTLNIYNYDQWECFLWALFARFRTRERVSIKVKGDLVFSEIHYLLRDQGLLYTQPGFSAKNIIYDRRFDTVSLCFLYLL